MLAGVLGNGGMAYECRAGFAWGGCGSGGVIGVSEPGDDGAGGSGGSGGSDDSGDSGISSDPSGEDIAALLASPRRPNFDGVWKEALHHGLADCFRLFWPQIHALIDWSQRVEFLEQELQMLYRMHKRGRRQVDKLAKVALLDGEPMLLLVHVEVQAGRVDTAFARRMLDYHLLLLDRHPGYRHFPCALLLDRVAEQSSMGFQSPLLESELRFSFPVVNLASWQGRVQALEALAPSNPFAVVVLAQLACRREHDPETRLVTKLQLSRSLKRWGYDTKTRERLLGLIDGLLVLPPALTEVFVQVFEQDEEGDVMEQLNSFQRVRLKRVWEQGREEGREEGRADLLKLFLTERFGPLPDPIEHRLSQASGGDLLRWGQRVVNAVSLEDVFRD